ncbi:hypothetical protein LguiB_034515 [Lonicera macranthoides]
MFRFYSYKTFVFFTLFSFTSVGIHAKLLSDQSIKSTSEVDIAQRGRHNFHVTRYYTFINDKPTTWHRPAPITLTYAFSQINILPNADIKAVFRRSFSRWSAVIPVNFRQVDSTSKADIKIGFYSRDHRDGFPFEVNELAHTFPPPDGRIHVNADVAWSVDWESGNHIGDVDLESVVVHEIGHVLGLGHSADRDSVMYPVYTPGSRMVELVDDDVEGIQKLYGKNPSYIPLNSSSSTFVTLPCISFLCIFFGSLLIC